MGGAVCVAPTVPADLEIAPAPGREVLAGLQMKLKTVSGSPMGRMQSSGEDVCISHSCKVGNGNK